MGGLQQMAQWANGQIVHLCEQSAAYPTASAKDYVSNVTLLVPNHTGVIHSYKGSAQTPCFHLPLQS